MSAAVVHMARYDSLSGVFSARCTDQAGPARTPPTVIPTRLCDRDSLSGRERRNRLSQTRLSLLCRPGVWRVHPDPTRWHYDALNSVASIRPWSTPFS